MATVNFESSHLRLVSPAETGSRPNPIDRLVLLVIGMTPPLGSALLGGVAGEAAGYKLFALDAAKTITQADTWTTPAGLTLGFAGAVLAGGCVLRQPLIRRIVGVALNRSP